MTTDSPAKTPPHLLHLEDSLRDADLIHSQIRTQWPDCAIKRVDTREGFLSAMAGEDFDLILSDFSLPAFNGLEALDLARLKSPATPFMFLSGTIGEDNAVQALQRGAVDYVIKDRPARLIPAMQQALVRRQEQMRQRQTEQQLREHAGLLDKARDAICVTDMEGRITYWNQGAARLFGWTGEEGRGRRLHELLGQSGPTLLAEALGQLHATGAWDREVQFVAKDKQLHHIESRWTLVHDADGRPQTILSINTDITEQKKLESQLLRTQRLEGIGTLAGGIAHDLNNVLSPILMAVNLLQMKLKDEDQLRLVGVLEKSALHGAALVRQVLAFARGAEGERADLRLHQIVKDVVTLLTETLPRSIAIETEVPRDLWLLHANATQLGQVLMNLGINARDAMPKGGRLVFRAANVAVDEAMAQANPGAKAGPHVQIMVVDSGTGIPPELVDRIFDPFFTTKAAGKGTGLGLSTVLGIIKGHGGFLQVRSEIGRGTQFRLYFPAVPTTTDSDPGIPCIHPPRGHGETVLVLDDEEGVREIVSSLLLAHGYRVRVATNGLDGLALYRAHQDEVQVVLTDMMMPGLQGAEIISELRRLNPDVRIVAMSGIGGELSAIPEDPGRLALLAKPMGGYDIVRAIQLVLGSRKQAT